MAVPCGIEVEGRRDDTAQAVFTLLDNARKHAAMSADRRPRHGAWRGDDAVRRGRRDRDHRRALRAAVRAGRARRRQRRLRARPVHRPAPHDRAGRITLDVEPAAMRRYIVRARASAPRRRARTSRIHSIPLLPRSSHDRARSRRRGSRPRRHRTPAGAVRTRLGGGDHRRPDGRRCHRARRQFQPQCVLLDIRLGEGVGSGID